jgi:thiol:disulfide interchange protein DsbC
MVDGAAIPKSMGNCDTTALDRNVALGQRYKVNGTPAVVFEDGTRAPGAIPAAQIEARMAAIKKS